MDKMGRVPKKTISSRFRSLKRDCLKTHKYTAKPYVGAPNGRPLDRNQGFLSCIVMRFEAAPSTLRDQQSLRLLNSRKSAREMRATPASV